jgi:molecular chaperone HtpG
VRRVYITDDAELLPSYLRFVRRDRQRGHAAQHLARCCEQSADEQIRKAVTSRVVAELANLAEKEADKFSKIWDTSAGSSRGIYEDHERHGQIRARPFTTTGRCGAHDRPMRG